MRPRMQTIMNLLLVAAACWGAVFCGGQRSLGASGKKPARPANYDQAVPLEFTLSDAYGRQVCAEDYRGVPVLISTAPAGAADVRARPSRCDVWRRNTMGEDCR